MNKIAYLIGLIVLCACVNKNLKEDKNETSVYSDLEKTFAEVDSILKTDKGNFWGHELNGPIILVDPKTRAFVANRNNSTNAFKKVNAVYLDTLPRELNIANTAFNWNDERWTMLMLPLPNEKVARNNLIIHELFHRIQPEIGYENLQELANGHLDTYEGRLLLKLELRALKKALQSIKENSRDIHIRNALFFRSIRQSNEQIKSAENSLEVNEGLAEFTGMMLSGRTQRQMNQHLVNSIDQFYTNATFVRSFAYQTIPIYGYLLFDQNKQWHLEFSKEAYLTDYFIKAFSMQMPSDASYERIAREHDYNYQNIVDKERIREDKRLAKIDGYKKKYIDGPTLTLYFEKMNISFDPRNITPLENYGTVYPNLRVTDNWGILTVENGALLSTNWGSVIVSSPIDVNSDSVRGDGWVLELNNGWEVKENADGFALEKAVQ